MEFKNEALNVSFTLPEKVTVRLQLAYFSHVTQSFGREMFERFWMGAKTIIQDWRCELVPDMDFDLDEVTDPRITDIVLWAGTQVSRHMNNLDKIPKN